MFRMVYIFEPIFSEFPGFLGLKNANILKLEGQNLCSFKNLRILKPKKSANLLEICRKICFIQNLKVLS